MAAAESKLMTVGRLDPEARDAFGRALSEALRAADISIASVARHVELTDDAVRRWLKGSAPEPPMVFAVERFLDVAPGDLSRHLGYIPVGVTSVTAAIDADEALNDQGKAILRDAYRTARRTTRS